MSDPTLTAQMVAERSYVNLRGDANDAAFRKAVEGAIGQPLPDEANTFTSDAHVVYWLGPDEWMIVSADDNAKLVGKLERVLAKQYAAVNDLSGGNVAFRLQGAAARELLAKGCTLDLHARVFTAGRCAQSGLAKANVLIGLLDDDPTFEIIVRRSFADYFERWLKHAGRNLGIEFV